MSEEKMCKSRMRETSKECKPDVSCDANENKERKEINEDKWAKPRNCMPIKYFFKPYENAEKRRKSDNKSIALAGKDEIEEEEDNETKKKGDELKMKTRKGVKTTRRS